MQPPFRPIEKKRSLVVVDLYLSLKVVNGGRGGSGQRCKTITMKERLKIWFYQLWYGHPFLLEEEVNIICETRCDEKYIWMNDSQIRELIKIRIKAMYKKKFPTKNRWSKKTDGSETDPATV